MDLNADSHEAKNGGDPRPTVEDVLASNQAVVIRANGVINPMKGDLDLEAYQAAVGGWIEYVNPNHYVRPEPMESWLASKMMIVNEEGAIKRLPPNPFASALMGGLRLFGDVVLVEESSLK